MGHNKKLKALIESLNDDLENSSSSLTLQEIGSRLRSFDGRLKYKDTLKFFSGLIMAVAAIYVGYNVSEGNYSYPILASTEITILLFGVFGLGLALVVFFFQRLAATSDFIELLFHRVVMLSYDLKAKKPLPEKEFKKQFNEFNRGNDSRKFKFYASGVYAGESGSFEYDIFHFHWVDRHVRTVTRTGANGQTVTETQTTYSYYDRYGIILKGYNRSIMVSSSKPYRKYDNEFIPTSTGFKKEFDVSCQDEFQASKLLKPAVVVALEDAVNDLKKVNIEFNNDEMLCITTESTILDLKEIWGTTDNASDIADYVERGTRVKTIDDLLALGDTVRRYTDNNFG